METKMNIRDGDSVIWVSNIWAEDLFKWFFDRVASDGGDGAAVIVCSNYKEVADWFVDWYCKEYNKEKFFHPKDEYRNIINFHDNNESYMFTNDLPETLPYHDYTFIVKGPCMFGQTLPIDKRIILPIQCLSI